MKYIESYNKIQKKHNKELKCICEQFSAFKECCQKQIVNKIIYTPIKALRNNKILVKKNKISCYELKFDSILSETKDLLHILYDKRPEQILFILFLIYQKRYKQYDDLIKVNNIYLFDIKKNKFFIDKEILPICKFLDKYKLTISEIEKIKEKFCNLSSLKKRKYLFINSRKKYIALTDDTIFLDRLNRFVNLYDKDIINDDYQEKIGNCLHAQIGDGTYIILSQKQKNTIIVCEWQIGDAYKSFIINLDTFEKEPINIIQQYIIHQHIFNFNIKKNKNFLNKFNDSIYFESDVDIHLKGYSVKKISDNCFLFLPFLFLSNDDPNVLLFNGKIYVLDINLFNEIVSNGKFKKMYRYISSHLKEIEFKHKQFCLKLNL